MYLIWWWVNKHAARKTHGYWLASEPATISWSKTNSKRSSSLDRRHQVREQMQSRSARRGARRRCCCVGFGWWENARAQTNMHTHLLLLDVVDVGR